MKKFLETYKLQKLTHEGIENMCVCTMSKEIESVTRNVSMKKSLAPEDFTGEFHQTFFFFFLNRTDTTLSLFWLGLQEQSDRPVTQSLSLGVQFLVQLSMDFGSYHNCAHVLGVCAQQTKICEKCRESKG